MTTEEEDEKALNEMKDLRRKLVAASNDLERIGKTKNKDELMSGIERTDRLIEIMECYIAEKRLYRRRYQWPYHSFL